MTCFKRRTGLQPRNYADKGEDGPKKMTCPILQIVPMPVDDSDLTPGPLKDLEVSIALLRKFGVKTHVSTDRYSLRPPKHDG